MKKDGFPALAALEKLFDLKPFNPTDRIPAVKSSYDETLIIGEQKMLEGRLAVRDFLVGEHLTIADITLYAYTHVAEEGGFDLSGYPAVQRWLAWVSNHPAHVTMNDPV